MWKLNMRIKRWIMKQVLPPTQYKAFYKAYIYFEIAIEFNNSLITAKRYYCSRNYCRAKFLTDCKYNRYTFNSELKFQVIFETEYCELFRRILVNFTIHSLEWFSSCYKNGVYN